MKRDFRHQFVNWFVSLKQVYNNIFDLRIGIVSSLFGFLIFSCSICHIVGVYGRLNQTSQNYYSDQFDALRNFFRIFSPDTCH